MALRGQCDGYVPPAMCNPPRHPSPHRRARRADRHRLRRPDRPGRVRSEQGWHRRPDLGRSPRPGPQRHPQHDHRAGHLRYAAAVRLGTPADYAKPVQQIVTNEMLNGEVIRLDVAIRGADVDSAAHNSLTAGSPFMPRSNVATSSHPLTAPSWTAGSLESLPARARRRRSRHGPRRPTPGQPFQHGIGNPDGFVQRLW